MLQGVSLLHIPSFSDLKLLQRHLHLLEKEYDLIKHECQHQSSPQNPSLDPIWTLLSLLKAMQLTMYDFMLNEHGQRLKDYQDPIGVPLRLLTKNIEAQNCTLTVKYGLFDEYTYKKFI